LRTLVTGAAGFIGSTLVERLLADGHHVSGVDDQSRGRLENLSVADQIGLSKPGSFSFHVCDITTEAFAGIVEVTRPEVVFHLAAKVDVRASVADPLASVHHNVYGTINLLQACQRNRVRKVVFASSGGSIYGATGRVPVNEQTPLDPCSPYGASKAAAELYLHAFASLYDLTFTSLALGNVYGPRQDPSGGAGVVSIFAAALLERRPTRIYGDGTATRDFVFVADVVDAFVLAAGQRGSGHRFNIGTGRPTSVRDLHTELASLLQRPDEPEFAPPRAGETQTVALNCAAAASQLGWRPHTQLETGLRLTARWIEASLCERQQVVAG